LVENPTYAAQQQQQQNQDLNYTAPKAWNISTMSFFFIFGEGVWKFFRFYFRVRGA
jgi:hypothetical protein